MDAQTLSIPKACRRLGISAATGRQLVNSGQIPTVKIGKRLRVPRSYLEGLRGTAQPTQLDPLKLLFDSAPAVVRATVIRTARGAQP